MAEPKLYPKSIGTSVPVASSNSRFLQWRSPTPATQPKALHADKLLPGHKNGVKGGVAIKKCAWRQSITRPPT